MPLQDSYYSDFDQRRRSVAIPKERLQEQNNGDSKGGITRQEVQRMIAEALGKIQIVGSEGVDVSSSGTGQFIIKVTQIAGPAGKDGKDGATGPQGPKGEAGSIEVTATCNSDGTISITATGS